MVKLAGLKQVPELTTCSFVSTATLAPLLKLRTGHVLCAHEGIRLDPVHFVMTVCLFWLLVEGLLILLLRWFRSIADLYMLTMPLFVDTLLCVVLLLHQHLKTNKNKIKIYAKLSAILRFISAWLETSSARAKSIEKGGTVKRTWCKSCSGPWVLFFQKTHIQETNKLVKGPKSGRTMLHRPTNTRNT